MPNSLESGLTDFLFVLLSWQLQKKDFYLVWSFTGTEVRDWGPSSKWKARLNARSKEIEIFTKQDQISIDHSAHKYNQILLINLNTNHFSQKDNNLHPSDNSYESFPMVDDKKIISSLLILVNYIAELNDNYQTLLC